MDLGQILSDTYFVMKCTVNSVQPIPTLVSLWSWSLRSPMFREQ